MAATPDDLAYPEFLVETEWLAAHLGQSDLRILDCTVHIAFNPVTMFEIGSGGADFERGHIPGAQFVDVLSELSDTGHPVPLMAPDAAQFASVMSAHGVADGSRVVLYSVQNVYWATRVWWLFRMFGFDGAAVPSGGWQKWRREGRPFETGPARLRPPAQFTVRRQRALMAGKDEVLAAIGDGAVCMINALPEDQHRFTSGIHYGRPGHIKGSVNLPSGDLLDPETNEFLPAGELRRRFDQVGAFSERVITYCGGGAAASADAMALVMLGHPDVKLYDGSLLEWATDPSLPMEVDPVPISPDQAVIAIENRRLLDELREALAQQAAMSEILQIINSSPGDLVPVFDAILEKAHTLCGAAYGRLLVRDGEEFHLAAAHGEPRFVQAARHLGPMHPPEGGLLTRLVQGERIIHIAGVCTDDSCRNAPTPLRHFIDAGDVRTLLVVPLRKGGAVLGVITAFRQEVRPFSDKQIALLESFAAQAVIAMENARLLTETREALEQQTATAEVLQVINSSPGNLAPVFDSILEKAHSLCDIAQGSLELYDGERFRAVAVRGLSDEFAEMLRQGAPAAANPATRPLIEGGRFAHIHDLTETDYSITRSAAELDAARTLLCVPLRRDGRLLGMIASARREVRPFSEKEIALLENFAAQAVIAMENARLLTETREALEQQTATAEVLQVINSSPGDLAPVFDAMLEKATLLCDAPSGIFWTFDGEFSRAAAMRGIPDSYAEYLRQLIPLDSATGLGRVRQGERVAISLDLAAEEPYRAGNPQRRAFVDLGQARSAVRVPLIKDSRLLGIFTVYRQEVRPFADKQIALLRNFAAQAVIAMENARLLTETREALEQQTATAEVLQVINSSPGDLAPVFDAILDKAQRVCGVDHAALELYYGGHMRAVAVHGASDKFAETLRQGYRASDSPAARALLEGERYGQIADAAQIDHIAFRTAAEVDGVGTVLFVPLRRDDAFFGMIASARREVSVFSEKEIALLENFAAQAVIAMENARLLDELRQRQQELRVTFDNMVDGVAMFDEALRLAAWNRNFQELLQLTSDFLAERPAFDTFIRYLAERGEFGETDSEVQMKRLRDRISDHYGFERTRPDGTVIEVRHNPMPNGGIVLIYSDITERKRSEAEIRKARDAAEAAYADLKAAQSSLIQAQKMAALGQLTAGIAHEIKNPLNFVNNFAALSAELLDE